MSGLRIIVPIRIKMISLLILSLVFCAVSVLWVGVSVFMEDKASFFFDYSQTQVQLAADSADAQIQQVISWSRLIQAYVNASNSRAVEKLYDEAAQVGHLKKLLVLKLTPDGVLQVIQSLGDRDGTLVHVLDQLGWDSSRFLNESILISKAAFGNLAVGSLVRSSEGEGIVSVFLWVPDLVIPENSSQFQFYLVDSLGESIASNSQSPLARSEIVDVLKPLLDEKESFGSRMWHSKSENFLVSYRRLKFKELSVIAIVPEKFMFSLFKHLLSRSIALEVGIIFIALGLVLLFFKQMSEGLRAMIGVTEKVQEGIFSYRVETKGMGNDEIGTLATSFNLMVGKIDDLMQETASQVESEYEAETSTFVQTRLFKSTPLSLSKVAFSGGSLFSKVYGGDWWHYEEVDDYIILVVGQVDAKGLLAALLVSAIRGALSAYRGMVKMMPMETPQLKYLASYLNTAIFEVGGGKIKLNCFTALIDTYSGHMEMMNFSFPIPYLHRLELEEKPENPAQRFVSIPLKKRPALGTHNTLRLEAESFQLQPGDMIFWYSSGYLKLLNPSGETMGSEKTFVMLSDLYDQYQGQAGEISNQMIEKLKLFFGEVAKSPPDDITVAFLTIPKKARLLARQESEVA